MHDWACYCLGMGVAGCCIDSCNCDVCGDARVSVGTVNMLFAVAVAFLAFVVAPVVF